ncbi:MAG: multicopper oxidase domain-containing protein [Burkholderiaceae bacterium]
MKRRTFLGRSALAGLGLLAGCQHPGSSRAEARAASSAGQALPMPAVVTPGTGAIATLDAQGGLHAFRAGGRTPTLGFGQAYLGPVIRLQRGQNARIRVGNQTKQPVTAHWHGLHVEGRFDGGPQTAFGPGEHWTTELDIDQPAATLWYHSHVHGQTGPQVYDGLAGMLIIDDPQAPPSGLPDTWGEDDLPLIVQDKAFRDDDGLVYSRRGPMMMHGFRAGDIIVNGAIRPRATVPAGLVRLRVLNASNARIYTFGFDDDRSFHQVATDGGLLAAPVPMKTLVLAPAERAEIIVDFAGGGTVRLLSTPDSNDPMGGGMGGRMMGRMMGVPGSPPAATADGRFEILTFHVDPALAARVKQLPARIAGAPAQPDWGQPARTREFHLDMGMGMGGGRGMGGGMGGGMGRGMGGMGGMGMMTINGLSMAMERIDHAVRRGETELWRVYSDQMAHPFHVHGTSFQVLSSNGRALPFATTGLKDVVLVDGQADLLVRFDRTASETFPYMFHCHILEHEDAGMMGQFTVT